MEYVIDTSSVQNEYSCIVFSASYNSPLDCISSITKELKAREVRGLVVFDLLLSHGNNPDRYFVSEFDGNSFCSPLMRPKIVPEAVKNCSLKFYNQNQDLLERSVLTKPQKFLIKKMRLI